MLYLFRGFGGMLVFQVGDKVVYPMHGAGIIEAVEERMVLGKTKRYYILRIPVGNMQVMVPTDVAGAVLRQVIDQEGVDKVYDILRDAKSKMSTNWNRRYRANLEKIKTGDIYEVAEVVRNLAQREREKGLSTGERKMLDNARQILLSELVLAQGMEHSVASSRLDDILA